MTEMQSTGKPSHSLHIQLQKPRKRYRFAIPQISKNEGMHEKVELTAHVGTAETEAAQLGALVIVVHEDDPLAGEPAVVEELLQGVEEDAGALVDELLAALADDCEVVVVLGDPPLPPPQDVVVAAGPLAQAHTAAAELKTGPRDAAGHPAITHGPAVA